MSTHYSTGRVLRFDVVTDEDIERTMLASGYSLDATTTTDRASIRNLFPDATDEEIERVQRHHGRDRSGVRIAAIAKTIGRAPFGGRRQSAPDEERADTRHPVAAARAERDRWARTAASTTPSPAPTPSTRRDAIASHTSPVARARAERDAHAASAWRTRR
jgi:hypothetical protein